MRKQIENIIKQYTIGNIKTIKKIASGYHSTNYKVVTNKGSYVIRLLHEKEKDVRYILKLSAYLIKKRKSLE